MKKEIKLSPEMSYAEYVSVWLDVACEQIADLSANTIVDYRRKLESHVCPVIGDTEIGNIGRDDVITLYEIINQKKLAATTVRGIFRIVSKTLNDAVFLFRILAINPCQGFRIKTTDTFDYHWLGTTEEIDYYIRCWRKTGLYLAVYLLLGTGLRRSELLALKWEDIDFEKGIMRVHNVVIIGEKGELIYRPYLKNKSKEKQLLLPDNLLHQLTERFQTGQYRQDDFVVHDQRGKPWHPSSFSKKFIDIKKTLPIDQKIRLHDLRHSHGTFLVNQGVDVKIVADRLGHSDPLTTLRFYVHNRVEDQKVAIQKLNF